MGVTGTNGKTTTAFLLRALLEAGGRQTGLLGTVTSIIGGVEHTVERTTPEAIDLQRTFAAMLQAGDHAVAIEVSSHALELHRADAIHFAAGIFTNLTQDHLDFHPTMEDYFVAKRRLFSEQDAAVYLTAAVTGLRRGELVALCWRDVDFPGQAIRVRANYSYGQLVTPKSGKVSCLGV